MDGQVAIKQVLGMFSAKVHDSGSNAEKVLLINTHLNSLHITVGPNTAT